MSEALLSVRRLSAGYGATTVVRELDLEVRAGESAVIIGPNGHGKTTLLRALNGLIRPTAGEVLLEGEAIAGRPSEQIARLGAVLVPQGDGLFPEMTVEDNLLMGAFLGQSWRDRRRSLARVYDLFPGVKARADQQARTLSGGERRLTALGRALMRPSKILMIDEPSLGLAPVALDAVYGAIAELKSAKTTILLVEENFTHVGGIADSVHVLEMGSITRSGSYQELSEDEGVVEAYLGSIT
ncbi:MAG TPA: ABC transporter ATP-binding protein [Acidimicrobiales bacterium]|nr:ABC transporter ATP-binding protein [Acidimicrobiales bacterium]